MCAAASSMIPEELSLLFAAAPAACASSSHDETKLNAVSVYEPRAGVSEPFRPALSPEGRVCRVPAPELL